MCFDVGRKRQILHIDVFADLRRCDTEAHRKREDVDQFSNT